MYVTVQDWLARDFFSSVKVINVNRKSQYSVRKVHESTKFSSVCSLKEHLRKLHRITVTLSLDVG